MSPRPEKTVTRVERVWPLAVGRVRLRAADARVLAQLEPWLQFFLPAPAGAVGSAELLLDLRADSAPPPPPEHAPPMVEYYYVTGYRGAAGPHFRTAAGSWLELDARGSAARGGLGEADLSGAPWALRDLFNAALTAWLRVRGRFVLHAAALSRGDAGVLIVGSAMAGKTTLGLNLARHGWGWIADDKVLLEESGEGVPTASGLLRHANLDPGLARWFSELGALAERPPVFAHTNKRAVDLTEISRSESPAAGTRPCRLLFPELLDLGPTRVEPLDAEAAFLRLLQQAPLVRDADEGRRHLALLRRLALGAPAFRVIAGRDILAEPARFAAVAAELGLALDPPRPFALGAVRPHIAG